MDNVFVRSYAHSDILAQQVVRPRVLPWRQEFRSYLLMGIVLVFCSLLFVWSRVEVVQMGYQISQANTARHELMQEKNRLEVELASLKSPSRIGEVVKQKMGLINPKREQIIIVP